MFTDFGLRFEFTLFVCRLSLPNFDLRVVFNERRRFTPAQTFVLPFVSAFVELHAGVAKISTKQILTTLIATMGLKVRSAKAVKYHRTTDCSR